MTVTATAAWHKAVSQVRDQPLLGAALLFGALTLGVYWGYLGHAGIFSDTWASLFTDMRDGKGLGALLASCFDGSDNRPVGCLVRVVEVRLIGPHPSVWLGLSLLIVWATAIALAALVARLTRRTSVGVLTGAVFVVMPAANATRLWPLLGAALAVLLFLMSLLVTLRAFESSPRWRRLLIHGVAVFLLVSSVGAYEVIAPLALVTWAVYLLAGQPLRVALARGAVDLVGVGGLILIRLLSPAAGGAPLVDVAFGERVVQLIRETARTFVATVAPDGTTERAALILALGGLVACAVAALLAPALRAPLLTALCLVATGVVTSLLGAAAFVATDPWYTPRLAGTDNRVNIVIQVGYVLVIAGAVLAMFHLSAGVARLAGASGRTRIAVASGLTAMMALPTAAVMWNENRFQQSDWATAWAVEQQAIAAIGTPVPEVDVAKAWFLFDVGQVTHNWVPAFTAWEATNAINFLSGRTDLEVAPFSSGAFVCGEAGLTTVRTTERESRLWPYGSFALVRVTTGAQVRPLNPRECRKVVRAWPPAAYFIP